MNLRQRLPIALVMLVVVVVCVQFLPLFGFFIVLEILILSSLLEFYHLFERKNFDPQVAVGCLMALIIGFSFLFDEISVALAFFLSLLFLGIFYVITTNKLEKLSSFPSSISLTLLGAVYLSFTLNYFFLLKKEKGAFYIYFFLAVIFLGDTGAYFFGKLWGRRKFLPIASPRKTWEGCIGGLIFACLGALAAQQLFLSQILSWKAIVCGLLVHGVAQISDPLESLFKRAVGVKDSSRILLGHGGFLDRVDSLILATPFFYYLIRYFWK